MCVHPNVRFTCQLALALVATATAFAQTPLGNEFTYQGRLASGGAPLNDTADFDFSLWDAAIGGNQIGPTLSGDGLIIVDGLLTVELDFGVAAFDGNERWLEVSVASPSGAQVVTLSPRQPLTASPYARTAVTALNAPNSWGLAGNTGTDPSTNFIGTTDNQPFEVRANNERALRLEPSGTVLDNVGPVAGNVIAGIRANSVLAGVRGATISGGGGDTAEPGFGPNTVYDLFGTIGGGYGNTVGTNDGNVASAAIGTIAGGWNNVVSASSATVGGGGGNRANGFGSVVAGGSSNVANGNDSTVGGGQQNTADNGGTVAGGAANDATGRHAMVPGGFDNDATAEAAFAAGQGARALHNGTFVWSSGPTGIFASSGPEQFLIDAIGGVGIGTNNPSGPLQIGNPNDLSAFKHGAAGPHHLVTNRDMVLNAFDSDGTLDGDPLFLLRRNVTKFDEEGSVVDVVHVTDQGNVGLSRVPIANRLEVNGDASKSAAGEWAANSDRRIKTNIETVTNALDTLDRVRLVSFEYTDDYQATHPGVGDGRYLNVIAQEFAQVFPDHVKGSGERLPDGSEILQVDTYPLTIYSAAAVQELRAEKDAEIATLRQANADLADRVAKLEAMVQRMAAK